MVSLSTMWGAKRFPHMANFVATAQKMGFSHVELNYDLSPPLLAQVLENGQLPVSSIHAPCPSPPVPSGVSASRLPLSSLEGEERRWSIDLAKATIDLAARLGAGAIVLHMGAVGYYREEERSLRRKIREGQPEAAEELRRYLVAERARLRLPFWQAALASLEELVSHAQEKGVVLGLENRLYQYEIPSLEELEEGFGRFGSDSLGYWHDVGHAEIQARSGFRPHQDWLARLGHRIVGMHLHDVAGFSDHQPPGRGTVDWDMIARHLPSTALRVCEISSGEPDQVAAALPFLRQKGIL
ncbi:MAG: sugar phosphate isomerase/epimerase [Chloroflexi bacterium]|nr:sugar phosphate isomerase/epimerase [Chloroflexota bacterium]